MARWRALGVTLLATALAVGLERAPLPGAAGATLTSVGLTPIIFGYLLVELAALAWPGGRALRTGGLAGRARLARASERAGIILALAAALGMFGPWSGSSGLAAPTAAAGSALLALLARWVTRRGLGNGYAILLVLPEAFFQAQALAAAPAAAREALAPLLGAALLAVGATYLALRRPLALRRAIPVPASGLLPLVVALWIESLGYGIGDLLGFSPGPELAGLAFMGGAFAIPLFAWLFNRPDLQRALAPGDAPGAVEGRLWAGTVKTAGWLAAVATALLLFPLPPPDELYFDPVRLALLTGAAMDLAGEWRARGASPGGLVEVWSEHRMYALAIIEEALQERRIPVLFRSRYLRTLLQLLGPHVPVAVCVPADRAEEARKLLAERLGPRAPRAEAA